MLEFTRDLRVITFFAILLCIVACLSGANGQDKSAMGMRIARVDVERLQSEYTALVTLRQQVDVREQELATQLQTWQQNALLNEADQKALGDLAVKEKTPNGLSAAEKATQKSLLDRSSKLNDDYQRLQNTTVVNVTDQDKRQLTEYYKLANDTTNRTNAAKQGFQTDVNTKAKAASDIAEKSFKDALEKVAKEKNYTVIYNSQITPLHRV